jgi:hypothetical protein
MSHLFLTSGSLKGVLYYSLHPLYSPGIMLVKTHPVLQSSENTRRIIGNDAI